MCIFKTQKVSNLRFALRVFFLAVLRDGKLIISARPLSKGDFPLKIKTNMYGFKNDSIMLPYRSLIKTV